MNRGSNKPRRVLMLELDSVSLPFVRRHLNSLPVLRELIDSGCIVETETSADIASASVWPTFSTGLLPGEHGHYFPFQWDPSRMRYYRTHDKSWRNELEYEPFWYDLARNGRQCMIFDVVQSVHNENPPCLEINDWSAQSTAKVHSSNAEILRQLTHRFGKRPIGMEIVVPKSNRLSARLLSQAVFSLKQKSSAIIWLGQSREWDFYLASIQDLHRAGHNLWAVESDFGSKVEPDALLQVYQALDRELARILDALGDDNTLTLLFTLNGMAPNRAQNHFLPQILHRLNRLYLTGERPGGISAHRDGLIARLRDKLPPLVQHTVNRLVGEGVQDWVVNREYTEAINWRSTPAFPLVCGGEGLIRLNLKGRERDGMLSKDDGSMARYVAWLKDRLREIRVTETGEPLITDIIDIRERFPGRRQDLLPDIALTWAPPEPVTEVYSDEIGTVKAKMITGRGGNHTGESFMVWKGDTMAANIMSGVKHIRDYRKLVGDLLS